MKRLLSAITFALVTGAALAQGTNTNDEVLAENALVQLTRSDYEADLLRIPPEMRREFAASPRRLTIMLNALLVDKTLARQARDIGLDRDPEVSRRLALEVDRFLSKAMMEKVDRDATAEFEARQADFMATARETYLLNKERYKTSQQVSASHILFDPAKHGGSDGALALAKQTRAQIAAGADFAKLAAELSDDPNAQSDRGSLGWFTANQMDPQFFKAASQLAKVGEVSEPVESSFGWHLIRLEGRRPVRQMTFDEASPQILAELKQKYIADKRKARLEAISRDPQMKVNQPAVDALLVKLREPPKVGVRTPQAK